MRSMTLALAMLTLFAAAPSASAAELSSEARRTVETMKNLVERNAWTGVERNYEKLLELNEDLPYEVHMMGAQAAATQGKTLEYYERMEAALAMEANDETQANVDAIAAAYCRVTIAGKERWHPSLAIKSMPFQPDQRRSVEYGQKVLNGSGSFKGMLPGGVYAMGEQGFSCEPPSEETIELKVTGKDLGDPVFSDGTVVAGVKPPEPEGGEGGGGTPPPDGLVIFHGPIATLGFAYMNSGKPMPVQLAELESDERNTAVQPGDLSLAGLGVRLGYEVGLSYKFAVAGTVAYAGGFGDSTMHDINGTLAAVVRPGDLRFSIGPSYGITKGNGLGIAGGQRWCPAAVNCETDPVAGLQYKGASASFGGAVTAGYGFMEFGDFQVVGEANASFRHDSVRPWLNAGVQVGIVPKVPRFEDF